MADQDLHYDPAFGPPSAWTQSGIVIMSVVTIILSAYVLYMYSGSRSSNVASNPPAQTNYTPIVDETRPAPSTTGQGGAERK